MSGVFFLAAVAPAAFLLHFIYVRDKWEREPLRLVLKVYFISFLTVIPAVALEAGGLLALGVGESSTLLQIALLSFGVVGLAEEGSKFLFLRWLAYHRREFDEVYDGILYGVTVSLGFATVENLLYVFSAPSFGVRVLTVILRALTAVPVHALLGIIMGYYIGRAKFAATPSARARLLWRGLALAVVLHGLYDFLMLSMGTDAAGVLVGVFALAALLLIAMMWVAGLQLIRHAQDASPFKRPYPLIQPLRVLHPAYKFCSRCGSRAPRSDRFCRHCGAAW